MMATKLSTQPTLEALDGPSVVTRILAEARAVHELSVEIYGKTFTFKYRKLLWVEGLQTTADAWIDMDVPQRNGRVEVQKKYSADAFLQAAIGKMFMTPDLARQQPFPLTPDVIRSLPPEVGMQFMVTLPQITAEQEVEALDTAKKVSSGSSKVSLSQGTLSSSENS